MMKISGYQNMGVFFQKTQMPQNTKQAGLGNQGIGNLPGNRDTVTISLFGQKNSSRIKNLIGQRQSLLERKSELINSTLENGGDVKSIQDMLDSYEEQLKELEQQISQEMTRSNREQAEKAQSLKRDDKPKTRQEIEQERISNLVDLSSGMSQAKTVQSSQTKVEGEARVLESEIKMDKGRTGDTEMTAKKEEELAQLQQKAAELTSKAAEISGEVIEKISEDNSHIKQEPAENEKIGEMEDTEGYVSYEESDTGDVGETGE